jgi:hypothetical protein
VNHGRQALLEMTAEAVFGLGSKMRILESCFALLYIDTSLLAVPSNLSHTPIDI